jgi:ABC-type maltose transport system permease subunit
MTPEMQQLRANITNTLPAVDTPTDNPYAAGSVTVSVPFVIFFMVTQKMLVTALSGAAVKE